MGLTSGTGKGCSSAASFASRTVTLHFTIHNLMDISLKGGFPNLMDISFAEGIPVDIKIGGDS